MPFFFNHFPLPPPDSPFLACYNKVAMRHQSSLAGPSGFPAFDHMFEHALSFTSADGLAFVQVPAASFDGRRLLAVRSPAFRDWLFAQCYSLYQTIPTAHALSAVRSHLEAQAASDPARLNIRVSRRVSSRGYGPTPDSILLDLANPEGHFVEISASGWQTTAANDVHFETSRSTLSLPDPAPLTPDSPAAAVLDALRVTLNLGPPNAPAWLRSLAWLLNAFRPRGPYPVLVLRGPSGSGKSFAARILRSLVDPCTAPLAPIPPSARELLSLAQHNWVLAFDHVAALSPPLADTLCRLSSGTGIAFRDDPHREPALLWITRPILLTVTDDFTPPPSLAARALIVDMPALSAQTRRTQEDLLAGLNRAFPLTLGALCDTISTILHAPLPAQPHPTRHADALAWAVAAAPALNCTADEIRRAFHPSPPSYPLVESVTAMLRRTPRFTGTATALAETLSLSQTPKVLSAQLKLHAIDLADAGVHLDFNRRHGGVRTIDLRASPTFPASSQPTDSKPLTQTPEPDPPPAPSVTPPLCGAGCQPADRMSFGPGEQSSPVRVPLPQPPRQLTPPRRRQYSDS